MKKFLSIAAVLAVVALSFSSCHRHRGCDAYTSSNEMKKGPMEKIDLPTDRIGTEFEG